MFPHIGARLPSGYRCVAEIFRVFLLRHAQALRSLTMAVLSKVCFYAARRVPDRRRLVLTVPAGNRAKQFIRVVSNSILEYDFRILDVGDSPGGISLV